MTLLTAYMDAWVRGDVDAVLGLVDRDCVVIESYGPVYRGADRIEQWMTAWLARGRVRSWTLLAQYADGPVLTAQWAFACTFDGRDTDFDGVSVARTSGGRLVEIREYATTAPLYEWTGTWRET